MLLKGEGIIRGNHPNGKPIEWGQILFLSPGILYTLLPKEDGEALLLQIPESVSFIREFLSLGIPEKKEHFYPFLHPLPFTPVLWEYTRNLKVLAKETCFSFSLTNSKLFELFSLLPATYSRAELDRLFFPVLKKEEEGFAHFIWKNYKKVKTVEELARLAGYSKTSFEYKFKETFGMPPYKWMMERKKEKICHELTHSELPIQELSDRCGFASPSQMNDFCKKHMGLTPGMIRRKSKF